MYHSMGLEGNIKKDLQAVTNSLYFTRAHFQLL